MARKTQQLTDEIRVFLVDDEPAVLRGLQMLLSEQPGLAVCGSAGESREALRQILALQPDLAVVDLSLGEGDGLELLQQLRRSRPRLKLLVFSMHDQVAFVEAAFKAGAHGYVTKEDGTKGVLEAIRILRAGDSYLTPAIAARIPDWRPRLAPSAS